MNLNKLTTRRFTEARMKSHRKFNEKKHALLNEAEEKAPRRLALDQDISGVEGSVAHLIQTKYFQNVNIKKEYPTFEILSKDLLASIKELVGHGISEKTYKEWLMKVRKCNNNYMTLLNQMNNSMLYGSGLSMQRGGSRRREAQNYFCCTEDDLEFLDDLVESKVPEATEEVLNESEEAAVGIPATDVAEGTEELSEAVEAVEEVDNYAENLKAAKANLKECSTVKDVYNMVKKVPAKGSEFDKKALLLNIAMAKDLKESYKLVFDAAKGVSMVEALKNKKAKLEESKKAN